MKFIVNPTYKASREVFLQFIKNFKTSGTMFADGQRNKIKLFEHHNKTYNIKAFKIPNIINQVVYKYIRKSKAARSYEYATLLLKKGIGTPQPIAYLENDTIFGIKDSYYISEQMNCDLTYRELVENPDWEDHENILNQFTAFCFDLHEKGIEFKDHSPGNTLIKKEGNRMYSFYLVDLNRMDFHEHMDFDTRMRNMSRLTPKKEMVEVMSRAYAKFYKEQNFEHIYDKMWFYTFTFQEQFQRKQKMKKKIKFWKN